MIDAPSSAPEAPTSLVADRPPTAEMPEPAVAPVMRARGLTKDFGDGTGVFDLDLDVAPGTVFGFIGPSGSGKTTTIRMLNGFYAPTAGTVEVFGERPEDFSTEARGRIGYLPQHSVLYPNLTVWENLNFVASIYGMPWRRSRRLEEVLNFVELGDARRKRLSQLSGGIQRRLGLAAALVHGPELLFLDEPTAGIDPVLRRHIWDHLTELRDEGRTLFVTTQYVGEAAYCDLVGVLVEGRLAAIDTPEGLRRAAYGGELVDLRTVEPLSPAALAGLRRFGAPDADPPSTLDDHTVRIVVEDAGSAIPELLTWCRDEQIDIETAEPFTAPFDDVFVLLVERMAAEAGDSDG